MTDIHNRIKQRRKISKLTQQCLADRLLLSKTAISQWERGLNKPSAAVLSDLCKVLNVDEEWLLTGKDVADSSCYAAFMAPFFAGVKVSAGYGCVSDHSTSKLFPVPRCAIKSQSNFNDICCFVASGDSMNPILLDGSVVAVNTADKDVRDGKMYVIRQNDLLRVKFLSRFPNELHVQSANPAYPVEVYVKEGINEVDVIGHVFWYSSVSL
ncbi:helix-turn-helix domain-containing protein (plasmid) [Shewanella sp. SNU WT4]|uniref:XRE family transcriptional regulator n=1 Tax=Shewanella sp. SNU WT4 TaxID=2590015 RepID=UPI001126136A|nr:XRE family transcriptional regulator [Shewanella sp. SNU WT4]QDF68670.1 helix-turn-helix domain-containing protein [Shewanella sp. SNU WT4]